MPAADNPLEHLVSLLARLPGLGNRSARRVALQLVQEKERLLLPLVSAIQRTAEEIRTCSVCGNLDTQSPCTVCTDPKRDPSVLCVVEDVAGLWAIERSHTFRGRYHVLGGTLSALDGRGPDALNFSSLLARLEEGGATTEIILATGATVDGQTTAHYVTERLRQLPRPPRISQLAQGIPFGGELDYLDDGTLGTAFSARREVA